MALLGKCGLVNFQAIQTGNYKGAGGDGKSIKSTDRKGQLIDAFFKSVVTKLHDAHSLDTNVNLRAIFYLVRIFDHQHEFLNKVFLNKCLSI